jgi:hypothetical protein
MGTEAHIDPNLHRDIAVKAEIEGVASIASLNGN